MARDLSIVIRCIGHKGITLRPGESLTIGRHASNGLSVRDGTVSRFHARIVWDADEDRPYVEDLESANGVEVDGVPVEGRGYLSGDNQVEVGDFVLALELRDGTGTRRWRAGENAKLAQSPSKAAIIDDSDAEVHLFGEKSEERSGRFEEPVELRRALLELEEQARTGTLHVTVGIKKTRVTFSMGRIVTAVSGKERGLDVLKALLDAPAGSWKFNRNIEPSEENLDLSMRKLLADHDDRTMRIKKPSLESSSGD